MTAEEFIVRYEQALATQQWASVEPLVHQDAGITFSNGAVHKGRDAVRAAFEQNFAAIKSEQYRISNVHWVMRAPDVAVYLFDFQWARLINGQAAAGEGRGTSVLVRNEGGEWQLLTEHLGPAPR